MVVLHSIGEDVHHDLLEPLVVGEHMGSEAGLVHDDADPPAGGERYESCLKLAKILQQGDSFTAQTVGLTMERRLLPPDSKEARALGERRRTIDWRMTMAAKFDTPLLPWLKNSRVRWRLARMRALRREEDVWLAVLHEQGLPTEPPENYP